MILLAIVVIAVPAVAIWNGMNAPKPGGADGHGHDHSKDRKLETKEVSPEQRKEAGQQLKNALKNKPVVVAGEEDKVGTGLAKKPTILIPKYDIRPPVPNDSGTATHWFKDESRSAMKAELNEKQRGS